MKCGPYLRMLPVSFPKTLKIGTSVGLNRTGLTGHSQTSNRTYISTLYNLVAEIILTSFDILLLGK